MDSKIISKIKAAKQAVFPAVRKFLKNNYRWLIIIAVVILIIVLEWVFLKNRYNRNQPLPPKTCSCASLTPTPTPTRIDPKIKEFGLKIDKLNILVPVIKDVDGSDKTFYNKALQNGVAHFKGTALPGEKGNTFIFGHSSADVKGDYSKIFATLNDLEEEDEIVIYYENNEHKYKVKEKKIVEATDLSVLKKGKKEILTLMTCWPIGTKEKRLIVRAEPS